MDIRLLNYSAGPFVGDQDLWNKLENREDLNVNVVSRLRYTPGVDVFGLQFDFIISHENCQIIKTGYLFGMEIAKLEDYVDDRLTSEINKKNIAEIVKFIWPYVVGAFAARCADNSIQMILPNIDFVKFADEVMLVSADNK